MRKILLIFICAIIYSNSIAQTNDDEFVGTWIYQSNDTIFKIKLQKCETYGYPFNEKNNNIIGGYYLSINGVVQQDFIKPMPTTLDVNFYLPDFNIYIFGTCFGPKYVGFTFYDQQKKHVNGEGLSCGDLRLISTNKLQWLLDEEYGLWHAIEGRDDSDEYKLEGFSVPSNVIMTKEGTKIDTPKGSFELKEDPDRDSDFNP